MKTIRLVILFLFIPIAFHAQTLTGLWTGVVSNDSTTVRKDQSFEIVLTQYKNKVYGFSRATFIVNDSLFYIVKRVKGEIIDNVCEVIDDEIVSYNFHGRLDKKVKMISTFRLDTETNAWRMDGSWKTNQTKKYYSISGKMDLKGEPDLEKSKIFPHLEELKLANDVAFYKDYKNTPDATETASVSIKEKQKQSGTSVQKSASPTLNKEIKKDEIAIVPVKSQPITASIIAKENKIEPVSNVSKQQPVTETNKVEQPIVEKNIAAKPPLVIVPDTKAETKNEVKAVAKIEPPKQQPVAGNKPAEQVKTGENPLGNVVTRSNDSPVAIVKEKESVIHQPTEIPKIINNAASLVKERKIAAPQIVNFKSDSLELSLYDNGEIDGDTVSVLLNAEIILARQGLKASAIKKTIYVPSGKLDSMTLVLYAENLGKYPPNTGLLVVHDGEDTYQVRFSADLQQNAAVIFRRKRN
jgi:hypothetical protein